jgi:hypothetical protein
MRLYFHSKTTNVETSVTFTTLRELSMGITKFEADAPGWEEIGALLHLLIDRDLGYKDQIPRRGLGPI